MNDKVRDEKTDELVAAILSLRTTEECYSFFFDLCTIAELKEMSRRLYAAKMLRDNVVYSEISEKTGLSTATISRVNRCLRYGNDGYATVLDRISKKK